MALGSGDARGSWSLARLGTKAIREDSVMSNRSPICRDRGAGGRSWIRPLPVAPVLPGNAVALPPNRVDHVSSLGPELSSEIGHVGDLAIGAVRRRHVPDPFKELCVRDDLAVVKAEFEKQSCLAIGEVHSMAVHECRVLDGIVSERTDVDHMRSLVPLADVPELGDQ